jgi:recombination protein RecT
VSLPVYQNQLIAKDPISGFKFDWEQEPAENEQAIGYYAYFKLINGFTAELYMTRKQIDGHAKRYSQSLKKGYGVWVDNYDAMALKTVIKLLLSRMAPLSVDMQKAVLSDQSVVKDVESGQYEYIDHQANEAENSSGLNDIVGNPSPEEPVIIEYDPVADAAVQPAADAAYRVDPETGEVLDSAAIPETQEGELLL